MKKLLSSILITSMLLVSLVSCGSGANTDNSTTTGNDLGLIEPGVIYAATSPDYPPFEYLDGSNIVGFDIDLLNAVAERAGLRVEYTPLAFDTIISAVQAKQYDVGMSAFTADPERKVLFGKPYYESAQVALLPANSTAKTVEDLKQMNIGAGLGTTGETAAKTITDDVQIITADVALPMLLTGQLDAYICDIGVANNAVATGKYALIEEPITQESVSMVFSEDNTALCDALNTYLDEFMQTQEYADLLSKYGLDK